MHQFKTGILAAIFSTLFFSNAYSQNTVSPYSAYGIGILSDKAYTSNIGMGKSGIAYSNPYFINSLNPALFADQRLTSFEAGLALRNTAIRDEVNRYDQTNGGLQYLALAFPILPGKLGVSISLNPYISKNYSISQSISESNTLRPQSKLFTGKGNISQFRLSTGYNLNKFISIGVEVNYNFGLITQRVLTNGIIDNQDTINTVYNIVLEETFNYSDLNYIIGARFKHEVTEDKVLALGVTYTLQNNLNTSRSKSLQYLNFANNALGSNSAINYQYLDQEGSTFVPAKLSAGLSLYKSSEWAISADYSYQNWTNYLLYDSPSTNLGVNNSINIGAELTPDATNSGKYLQRISYRAGFFAENGQIKIDDTAINNFGITFGVSAPINKISNLNLGFQVGQRGTLENSLVRENYFGLSLSFTFNDRWFLRRQFD
ncbi:MAG: hypothetical protein ACI9C9_001339 [Marivirga sp.]|jgi:hypothetical protein